MEDQHFQFLTESPFNRGCVIFPADDHVYCNGDQHSVNIPEPDTDTDTDIDIEKGIKKAETTETAEAAEPRWRRASPSPGQERNRRFFRLSPFDSALFFLQVSLSLRLRLRVYLSKTSRFLSHLG